MKDVNLKNQASDTLQEIPAGYYRVIVSLTKGTGNETKIAGKSDIVHIYKGRTTELDWTFGANDFSDQRSYFVSIEDLETYLAAQPVNTAASPYPVKLRVNMADLRMQAFTNINNQDPLGKLYRALHGRYVEVDLTDSIGDILDGSFTGTIAELRPNYDRITKITLPSGLKRIGNFAFYRSDLTIIFPASLEEIGASAFVMTPKSSFDFSNTNLKKIEQSAFANASITSINLGTKLTEIGSSAFAGCAGLTTLQIPATVNKLGSGIVNFQSTAVTTTGTGPLTIQNGFWIVEEGGIKTLIVYTPPAANPPTALTIPAGVTVIGESVFASNATITSVALPAGLKKIGNRAFQNCNNLETINLPDTLESIGMYALPTANLFVNADIVFPASLKELGDYAFGADNTGTTYNGSKLRKADLSQTKLTHIGQFVFASCPNLAEVILPNTLKSIGDHAFVHSVLLGNITFPASLESIGQYAFAGTKSGQINPLNTARTEVDLSGCSKLTSIGTGAFSFHGNLVTVRFPNGLKTIGSRAFQQCDDISSLTFPASLEMIGDNAFQNNSGNGGLNSTITNIVLPANLERLENDAFTGFTGLLSVTFPKSLTYIGPYVFRGSASLDTFVVDGGAGPLSTPDGKILIMNGVVVAAAPGYAGAITIPEGVTEIGSNAFNGYNAAGAFKVTSVTMPASLTKINDGAFRYCTNLTSVIFPLNCQLTAISGSYVFGNCTNAALSSLDFSNTRLASLGTSTFNGCSNLETITFPDTIRDMGAFTNFTGVKNGATLVVKAVTPPTVSGALPAVVTAIQVPSGSVAAYKAAPIWVTYEAKIGAISP